MLLSCGDPVQPAAEADQRASGTVDVPDAVQQPAPATQRPGVGEAWPPARAATLIQAWQAWAPSAPDELDATLRLTAAGDRERLPQVDLVGNVLGSQADAAELLGELVARVGADPAAAARRQLPYRAAKRYLDELGSLDGQRGRAASEQPPRQGHFFRFHQSVPTHAARATDADRAPLP